MAHIALTFLQIIESFLPPKPYKRGYTRAFNRGESLKTGFAKPEGSNTCYVACHVPPSMRLDRPYEVRIALLYSDTGRVLTISDGFCECPAGAMFNCQHVGAALWTIHNFALEGGRLTYDDPEITCTSLLRGWGVGKGNLKSSVLEPIEAYLFRKVEPRKKKKAKRQRAGSKRAHDNDEAKDDRKPKRSRTIKGVVEQGKKVGGRALEHVDIAAVREALSLLLLVNDKELAKAKNAKKNGKDKDANDSGVGANAQDNDDEFNNIDWGGLNRDNYPKSE